MIEREALHSIRNEIARSVAKEQRPESLQDELLDELCAVDRQINIGGATLFALSRREYQVPVIYQEAEVSTVIQQEQALF